MLLFLCISLVYSTNRIRSHSNETYNVEIPYVDYKFATSET